MFDLVDKDKSGALSVEEVRDLMAMLGFKSSLEEVTKMVAEIDTDRSGMIDFDEFLAARSPACCCCCRCSPHFLFFGGGGASFFEGAAAGWEEGAGSGGAT